MMDGMNTAKSIIEYRLSWQGKICIFGAGKNGTEWVYDFLAYLSGFKVDFYCDNYKSGQIINNIPVYDFSTAISNDNVLYCISVYGEPGDQIKKQLIDSGCQHVLLINDKSIMGDLSQYLMENCEKTIQEMFSNLLDDRVYLKWRYNKETRKKLNLENPATFNEKMQWIKLNERNPLFPIWADKYAVREYIKNTFGEEYLVPLVMYTYDVEELRAENMPDYPVIIKTNAGCHDFEIIRDKNAINWEKIREKYRKLLQKNYYYQCREWHYKDIKPCIVVEKLLLTKEGKIPDDYKLQFFNGELQYIYCSIDREGRNYRKIYDPEWKFMEFIMGSENEINYKDPDIGKPSTFDEMVRLGKKIATQINYVRMDYYDVDGKLYFGEVTLCHGAGFDEFKPESYDLYWGEKLKLEYENSVI